MKVLDRLAGVCRYNVNRLGKHDASNGQRTQDVLSHTLSHARPSLRMQVYHASLGSVLPTARVKGINTYELLADKETETDVIVANV